MPVGLEAIFTMLSFYRVHVFTEKLVDGYVQGGKKKTYIDSFYGPRNIILFYSYYILYAFAEVHVDIFCMILHSKFSFVTKLNCSCCWLLIEFSKVFF